MIIYQGARDKYKDVRTQQFANISKQRSKRVTTKRTLNNKNKKFLKSLGFRVKN